MAEVVTSLIDLYAHIYIHGKIYFDIWKDNFKVLRSMEEVAFVHQCKCIKKKQYRCPVFILPCVHLFRRPLTAAILHSPGLYALKGLSLECFVLSSSAPDGSCRDCSSCLSLWEIGWDFLLSLTKGEPCRDMYRLTQPWANSPSSLLPLCSAETDLLIIWSHGDVDTSFISTPPFTRST